jgi:hypothetical protein
MTVAPNFREGVNVKPSSIQPVTPPIIIFTGNPSRPRRSAALFAPLQCGWPRLETHRVEAAAAGGYPAGLKPLNKPASNYVFVLSSATWFRNRNMTMEIQPRASAFE